MENTTNLNSITQEHTHNFCLDGINASNAVERLKPRVDAVETVLAKTSDLAERNGRQITGCVDLLCKQGDSIRVSERKIDKHEFRLNAVIVILAAYILINIGMTLARFL